MIRKINNIAFLLVLVMFTTTLTFGQTPGSDEAATDGFLPQLQFVGQEPYDVNGIKGTRYKLSVRNRSDHPDFLWSPSGKPCGKNKNASRTSVEIFASHGDKKLYGFCGVRSSEDLAHLWFPVQSGEKGPQCVYVVMTDHQTGRRYISNQVCSRSFTVVRGSLKSNGAQAAAVDPKDRMGNFEIQRIMFLDNENRPGTLLGNQPQNRSNPGPAEATQDPGKPINKSARVGQPDLRIRQFLFPPTNDKALRVHVVNTGKSPSGACRLVITVRKINGVAVGRKTHVNVPPLAAGADDWLHIDVKSILPNNISLQSTTFKLNVDATGIIAESDEGNNEVWHNL